MTSIEILPVAGLGEIEAGADLASAIHSAIDLKDGKLDGRVAPTPPVPCPKCQRVLAKNRARCLFCGEPIAADPFQR